MKDLSVCGCNDEYTFEEHGQGYALYFGRCPHRHGYNIANIESMDMEKFDEMLTLLSLYSSQEAKIAKLAKQNKSHIQGIINLEAQVEQLKCCGNCGVSYTTEADITFCILHKINKKGSNYCPSYQPDNLTKQQRSE